MDMSQYLEIFIEESKEHLQNLNESLLLLEKSPNEMTTLNEIFRLAHTLKGIAGTMGFSKIATLTHDMEDVLQIIRNGEIVVTSNVIDILFKCLDALENYLNEIINTGLEGNMQNDEIIKVLNEIANKKPNVTKAEKKPKDEAKVTEKTQKPEDESLSAILLEGTLKDMLPEQGSSKITKKDNKTENQSVSDNQSIEKSTSIGYNVTIKLNPGCLLKAARAYIVFQTLEKHADIIRATPSIQEIEDEKFEFQFSVVVIPKASKEQLIKSLSLIAEVDNVSIEEIDIEDKSKTDLPNEDLKIEEKVKPIATITQETESSTAKAKSKVKSSEEETVKAPQNTTQKPKTGKTVRVDIDRLDTLMNLVSELIIIKTTLEGVVSEELSNYNETIEYLERITTNLHDAVMKVRMVPVEMVFNRFPRMIRDLAKELNKEIILNMSGEETEVDRTVIDEIGDPLIHLLRNSADHGIEEPAKRKALGKPETGIIILKAYQDGNTVVIEVEDNGAGINIEKVRRKIVEKGFANTEVALNLTENEVIEYLFRPSFSTADKVTDVSGRGVGLDVVKTKIESLGGLIEVETEPNKGSRFIIRLPLTLAIIQALLIVVSEEKYAIPLSSIKEIINIYPNEIKVVQHQEVYMLRNQVIPIVKLAKVLNVPNSENSEGVATIVIVRKGDKLFGVLVDSLIGQQEIVIKSLGKYLSGIRSIAGATILGDGQVALILDVNSLV